MNTPTNPNLDLAAMRAAAERLIAANAAMDPPPRLHKQVMDAIGERDDARRAWWNMVHDPAVILALLARLERAEEVCEAVWDHEQADDPLLSGARIGAAVTAWKALRA